MPAASGVTALTANADQPTASPEEEVDLNTPLPEDEEVARLEQETMPEAVESSLADSFKKTLIPAAVLGIILVIAYFSPCRQWLDQWREKLPALLQSMGMWAPAVFTAGTLVLVTIGVPRLAMCTVGGVVFGFWGGLIWSQLGTLFAYYLVFVFIRWGGYRQHVKSLPQINRFSGLLRRGGIPAVILARQVPLHGLLINLMLGLSNIRHRDFLLGSLIGLLPEAIPFAMVGASVSRQTGWSQAGYLVGAVVLVAVVWLLLAWHLRRRKLQQRIQSR